MLNEKGFTLIEIIAVMVILGVLVVIGLPRFIKVDHRADQQGLEIGIKKLNEQEKLLWSKHKLSSTSHSDEELDAVIFADVDTSLGNQRYQWSGATLRFGSTSMTLERIPATNKIPAIWKEKE